MNDLHTPVIQDEITDPVLVSTALCCGAPDVETTRRLHPAEHSEPQRAHRPVRLANVRRAM